MEVTVKTLDGKNRKFTVPDDRTVRQFKEAISNSIGITADTQRLIYQGKVLQDDKKLGEYNVDGHVIHVVQRPPPNSRPGPTPGTSSTATTSTSGATPTPRPAGHSHGPLPDQTSYVLGSFTLPTDLMDPAQVQNVVQNVISGMGDVGRNARVSTRSAPDGSSVDVHINLGQISVPQVVSESQRRLHQLRHMINQANNTLTRLENPPRGSSPSERSPEASPADTPSPPGEMEADMDLMDDIQMDAENSSANTPDGATGGADSSSEGGTGPASSTTGTSGGSSTTTTTSQGTQSTPRGPSHPPVTRLGEMLGDVFALQRRLQPHLERFQRLMEQDPAFNAEQQQSIRANQRLFNLVTEAMHYVSHAYHLVSDLMVNMNDRPPRQLRAPPVAHHHPPAAVVQHTAIPMQVPGIPQGAFNMAMPGMPEMPPPPPPTTSSASTTASSTAQSGNVPSGVGGAAGTTPGGPPIPGLNVNSSNPYVFMEVGPHAFTINSISAHMVTTGMPQGSTTATQSQNSHPASSTGTTSTNSASAAGSTPNVSVAPGPQPVPFGPPPGVFRLHVPSGAGLRLHVPPGAPGMRLQPPPGGPPIAGIHFGPPPPPSLDSVPPPPGPGGAPAPPFGMPLGGGMNPDVIQNVIRQAAQQAIQHAVQALHQEPGADPATNAASPATSSPASSTPSSTTAGTTTASTATTGGSTTSTTSTTTAGTTPGGATTANGAGRPPRGATFVLPGMPGMMRPPRLRVGRPVDPFLHCQSRHFLAQRAARAARASGQTGGNTSTANQPPAPPEQALAGMVSNIVSSIIGHQGLGATPMAATHTTSTVGGPRPANPFATMFAPRPAAGPAQNPPTSTGPQTGAARPPGAAPGGASGNQFIDMMRNILAQGARQQQQQQTTSSSTPASTSSTSSASTSATTSSSGQSGNPEITDEMFAHLTHGICEYVARAARGQQPQETMADFLNNLSQTYSIPQGEGLVSDIFNCVASTLTFPDFMAVFYGQSAPLQRLREPLQTLIRDKVLEGREPTQANVNTAVKRLLSDMSREIDAAVENQSGREDINLEATYREFLRQQLTITIQLIMNSQDGDTEFGTNFHQRLRTVMHEIVALSVHVLDGGEAALHRMVEDSVRSLVRGVNPVIQEWMIGISRQELNRMLPQVSIQPFALERYIVRGSSMDVESATSPENMETSPAASANSETAMDVANEVTIEPPPQSGAPRLPPDLLSTLPPPPIPNPRDNASDNTGDDSWQQVVPREWVPVIIRDVNRQRRQQPQGPLSDAYINGMPAKRRKLMAAKRDHDDEVTRSESIPEAIRQAAQAANVEPITSMEALSEDVARSSTLHNAFDREISTVLAERIKEDSDYVPQKYPNAEKLLEKK